MPRKFLGLFCLPESFIPIPGCMGTHHSAVPDCPTGTVLLTMHRLLPSRLCILPFVPFLYEDDRMRRPILSYFMQHHLLAALSSWETRLGYCLQVPPENAQNRFLSSFLVLTR
uniref:Uncharacterized protein n=1 Tax=Ixodes ricinus TaxID=34613 RepID=A0A6B0UKH5_IXORI